MSQDILEAPVTATAAVPAALLPTSAPDRMGGVNEFLTFRLGAESYGIDILRVQEIRSFECPTRMANAPPYILGVTNLRGVIVPIVDLRLRFGLDNTVTGDTTVTIVLALGKRVVGVVVDGVSDVVTLSHEQMRPAPEFSSSVESGHIHAIGTVDGRMLILIDIVALMSGPGMGLQD